MKNDIIGYSGTGPNTGIFVAADDALDFAMERCGVRMVDRWVKEVATDDQRTA